MDLRGPLYAGKEREKEGKGGKGKVENGRKSGRTNPREKTLLKYISVDSTRQR